MMQLHTGLQVRAPCAYMLRQGRTKNKEQIPAQKLKREISCKHLLIPFEIYIAENKTTYSMFDLISYIDFCKYMLILNGSNIFQTSWFQNTGSVLERSKNFWFIGNSLLNLAGKPNQMWECGNCSNLFLN